MKMTAEHYKALGDAIVARIAEVGVPVLRAHYDSLLNADKRVLNLEVRWRWDMLWMVKASIRQPLMVELYKYLDDSHIDTALKAIVRERLVDTMVDIVTFKTAEA